MSTVPSLSGGNRFLVASSDFIGFVDAHMDERVARFQGADANEILAHKMHLANRVVLLGISLVEFGAVLAGAKPETLQTLKTFELLPRILNLSLKSVVEAKKCDGTAIGIATFLQKGVIAPGADVLKTAMEVNYYGSKSYAENGVPYFDKENVEEYLKKSRALFCVSVGANLRLGSIAVVAGAISLNTIQRYVRLLQQRDQNNVPLLQNPDVLDEEGNIDLCRLNQIPAPLEEDSVFSRYTCAITLAPIRFVRGDPVAQGTLYERAAIEACLARLNESPVTRQRLTVEQLLPKTAIQELIDHRLRQHSQRLNEIMQQALPIDGIPANLLQAAQQEFPE